MSMSDEKREFEGDVATEDDVSVTTPRPFNVIMHNDNFTTMEFVVDVLVAVFHHPRAVAARLMQDVHVRGKAIAGTYTFEIAETKAQEAMALARKMGHPLRCSVEPA
jgi:ATP-dependent Clp protease adaptor protein ClpS